MAITVQTNLGALSASRNLNINQNALNKSIERLSSGFRINRAADDAAGFAIAAKLSGQNARLQAASGNALQATSLVQMADSSANAIQNMLTRLQTLATQAASAQNAAELTKLDNERQKLQAQINKVANSTNFNGVNLLNGVDAANSTIGTAATSASVTNFTTATGAGFSSTVTSTKNIFENAKFTISTTAGVDAVVGSTSSVVTSGQGHVSTVAIATGSVKDAVVNKSFFVQIDNSDTTAITAKLFIGTDATGTVDSASKLVTSTSSATVTVTGFEGAKFTIGLTNLSSSAGTSGVTFSVTGAAAAKAGTVTSVTSNKILKDANGNQIAIAGVNLLKDNAAVTRNTSSSAANITLTLKALSGGAAGSISIVDAAVGAAQKLDTGTEATLTASGAKAGVLVKFSTSTAFQVGANNTAADQVQVDLTKDFTSKGLGITGDLKSQANAQKFIDTVKAALNNLALNRATLGSTQNQLGFVNDSLATSIEQVSAAISIIKDANLATETANFAKNQILVQAGTSMLAQANTASRNVLRLFR